MPVIPPDIYGTDVAALTDLPDPESLVTGTTNVAYAIARRWLTQSGALVELGDTTPYTSFDLRDYLGARVTPDIVNTITNLCQNAATDDVRVQSCTVVVTFAGGALSVSARVTSNAGPFAFVLNVTAVSASLMLGA